MQPLWNKLDGATELMLSQPKTFHDVVRERYSARTYLPDPVPEEVIRAVLDDARRAPSNANIQPWEVHIVSGATRDKVSAALLADEAAGRMSPDYPFGYDELYGEYSARQIHQAEEYYKSIGVSRDAKDDRRLALLRNLEFFGAPHACFLFLPPFYDSVRIASDIGMYGQTFLLSLTAHGLQGCPQTLLGFFAGTIRELLGIDAKLKMLFGISFGYPDLESQGAQYRIDRAPIDENVTIHR